MPKKKRSYTHSEEYLRKHKPTPEKLRQEISQVTKCSENEALGIPSWDKHPEVQITKPVPAHLRTRPFRHLSLASEVKKQEPNK